jgi:hypothetical protein
MKQIGLKRAFLIAAAFTCGFFGSLEWSQNDGLSVFATSAQARIGRPNNTPSGPSRSGGRRGRSRRALLPPCDGERGVGLPLNRSSEAETLRV